MANTIKVEGMRLSRGIAWSGALKVRRQLSLFPSSVWQDDDRQFDSRRSRFHSPSSTSHTRIF